MHFPNIFLMLSMGTQITLQCDKSGVKSCTIACIKFMSVKSENDERWGKIFSKFPRKGLKWMKMHSKSARTFCKTFNLLSNNRSSSTVCFACIVRLQQKGGEGLHNILILQLVTSSLNLALSGRQFYLRCHSSELQSEN